jgi:hypothetical protein
VQGVQHYRDAPDDAFIPGLMHTRHVGELHGVVRRLPDRLGEIEPDLALVDVEGRGELDVADVIAAEPRVHEAGDEGVVRRVTVVLHTLHERRGAVADADDGDSNGAHTTSSWTRNELRSV